MGFLDVLKIIGIVIGGLILLIISVVGIILASPVWYKGKITYDQKAEVDIRVRHMFGLIYGWLVYKDGNLDYRARILWERLDEEEPAPKKKSSKKKKKNRPAKTNPSYETDSVKQVTDNSIMPLTNKKIKKGNKNKKSIFKRLKDIYNGIRYKILLIIDNIRDVLDNINDRENREAVKLALEMFKQPVSYFINRKLKVRVKLGTDDPASTGEILGAAYAFAAVAGFDLIIEPDFQNKIFELDAHFKGHVSIYKIIVWVLRLYSNDKIKTVFDEVL